MENPTSWTDVEHTISIALYQYDMDIAEGRVFGFSKPKRIANALRAAGLLKEEDDGLQESAS